MSASPSDCCCCSWSESPSALWLCTRRNATWCEFWWQVSLLFAADEDDEECICFAGSTESPTRWTTEWWMTPLLAGEQRSANRIVQSIISKFCSRNILFSRQYKCHFSPIRLKLINEVGLTLNEVRRWSASLSARSLFRFRVIDFVVYVNDCASVCDLYTHWRSYRALMMIYDERKEEKTRFCYTNMFYLKYNAICPSEM